MITAKQQEELFRAELKALLKKYRAEIELTPRPFRPGDMILVSIKGKYDKNGDTIAEYAEFEL